jgi:hypothetical protein
MDKISINALAQDSNVSNNGSIDIKTLALSTKSIADNFSPLQLIQNKKVKREKLLTLYKYYYQNCLEKIKLVNMADKTDLFYTIPLINLEYSNYSPSDCIDFIILNLSEHKLSTYKINNTTLFITWKYLEIELK